ncbi:MAG: 50S ribosomal protein L15 [Candidatus Peregrinibacteria bacterium]|nr:50S ribosomal protein L15 [Candidatus Peregrinibacteria bacterium]
MSLQDLRSKVPKKRRKLLGRGNASGHGTSSTRGGKGQTARAGSSRKPGFEGGQTPLLRKMPKLRGFKNPCQTVFRIIFTGNLNAFEEGTEVNEASLIEKKLISKKENPIKLLSGKGKLEKKLKIVVNKASKGAITEVESAKGNVELTEKFPKK